MLFSDIRKSAISTRHGPQASACKSLILLGGDQPMNSRSCITRSSWHPLSRAPHRLEVLRRPVSGAAPAPSCSRLSRSRRAGRAPRASRRWTSGQTLGALTRLSQRSRSIRHHPWDTRFAWLNGDLKIARVPVKDASLCRRRPAPTAAGPVCGIKPARLSDSPSVRHGRAHSKTCQRHAFIRKRRPHDGASCGIGQ